MNRTYIENNKSTSQYISGFFSGLSKTIFATFLIVFGSFISFKNDGISIISNFGTNHSYLTFILFCLVSIPMLIDSIIKIWSSFDYFVDSEEVKFENIK